MCGSHTDLALIPPACPVPHSPVPKPRCTRCCTPLLPTPPPLGPAPWRPDVHRGAATSSPVSTAASPSRGLGFTLSTPPNLGRTGQHPRIQSQPSHLILVIEVSALGCQDDPPQQGPRSVREGRVRAPGRAGCRPVSCTGGAPPREGAPAPPKFPEPHFFMLQVQVLTPRQPGSPGKGTSRTHTTETGLGGRSMQLAHASEGPAGLRCGAGAGGRRELR